MKPPPRRSAIYFIEHVASGKTYVGKTVHPDARWARHLHWSKNEKKAQTPLYCALRKYGAAAFAFTVIEWHDTEDAAYEAEAFFVEYLLSLGASLYNLQAGGRGGRAGGNGVAKGQPLPAAWRAAISASQKGRKHSPEALRKMSENQKGRKLTDEHKARISAGQRGRRHPQQRKESVPYETIVAAREMRRRAMTIGEIAEALALSLSVVKRITREEGAKRPGLGTFVVPAS